MTSWNNECNARRERIQNTDELRQLLVKPSGKIWSSTLLIPQ